MFSAKRTAYRKITIKIQFKQHHVINKLQLVATWLIVSSNTCLPFASDLGGILFAAICCFSLKKICSAVLYGGCVANDNNVLSGFQSFSTSSRPLPMVKYSRSRLAHLLFRFSTSVINPTSVDKSNILRKIFSFVISKGRMK